MQCKHWSLCMYSAYLFYLSFCQVVLVSLCQHVCLTLEKFAFPEPRLPLNLVAHRRPPFCFSESPQHLLFPSPPHSVPGNVGFVPIAPQKLPSVSKDLGKTERVCAWAQLSRFFCSSSPCSCGF